MSKIIIPVKCSTVKKTRVIIEKIVNTELVAVAILSVMWSITMVYVLVVASASISGPVGILSADLAVCILFGGTLLALAFDVPSKIYQLLPEIACIADTEEESK